MVVRMDTKVRSTVQTDSNTMAATLVVSLFLPVTLKFHDQEAGSKVPTRPPSPSIAKRRSVSLDLTKRMSTISLLNDASATEEFFGTPTGDHQKRLSANLGDPRALLHSDPETAAWGAHFFNQPHSRAGPLPDVSVLEYYRVADELQQQKERDAERRKARPSTVMSPNLSPRSGSSEGDYGSRSWTVTAPVHGNNGLTNAMRAAERYQGINMTWIGTIGFPTDALPGSTKENIHDQLLNEYQSEVVYVSDKDLNGHYSHYCKTILWPIFHYHVPDNPKSKAYADHSWEFYRNVNKAFADKVVAAYKCGDKIWVHDYHLLLAPAMIRKEKLDAEIGFFLHTAFPSSELFRCLANRKELLEGMLGANLVAFQTDEYVQHFLQTCSRLLMVETTGDGVQLDDRFVNVTSQPIGINPVAIQEARTDDEVERCIAHLQERYKGKKIIVARDKFDNVYGVRQKLLAYEVFLKNYPERAKETVLIQVATSTSEHSEAPNPVNDIITRIERNLSDMLEGHQPLMWIGQDINFSQYLALLTVADAFISSPLRDGMGLTAHDFIFCQSGKHSPLLLSEFAGSAEVFHDHIPINPWDYSRMADAIKKALEMDETEKEQRWHRLDSVVQQQTGSQWAHELCKTLAAVYEEQNRRDSATIPRLSVPHVRERYEQTTRRLFFIDYEGTLTPRKTNIGITLGQQQRIVDMLNDLTADPKNTVYIMSNLQSEELARMFHLVSGLGLIAENGCVLRECGQGDNSWQTFVQKTEAQSWKNDVKGILRYYQERMQGATIEERDFTLAFHYEDVEDEAAILRHVGECIDQITAASGVVKLNAIPNREEKVLLIKQQDLSKKTAATYIFDSLYARAMANGEETAGFLMVAGNDREDEGVFTWANDLAKQQVLEDVFTVLVGKRNTEASTTLPQGSTGLITVLEKLAKISLNEMPIDYLNQSKL